LLIIVSKRSEDHRQLVRVRANRLKVIVYREQDIAGADECLYKALLEGLNIFTK
jgi:hypothetical protein